MIVPDKIYTISIEQVISSNPLALALHLAHDAVLRNDRYALVPHRYLSFMRNYANVYKSKTNLVPLDIKPENMIVKSGPSDASSILWFSGGSDCTLLSTMINAPKVRAVNFLPIPDFRFKQEFQLALAATVLGRSNIYLGTNASDSDYGKTDEIWDFENNLAFAHLWNEHFPSRLHYTLAEQKIDKVDVYLRLKELNKLHELNHCKHDSPCWECFDCVSHFFLLDALNVNVTRPSDTAIDRALNYAKNILLKDTYDDPHFVRNLRKLHDLTGYHMWERLQNAVHS